MNEIGLFSDFGIQSGQSRFYYRMLMFSFELNGIGFVFAQYQKNVSVLSNDLTRLVLRHSFHNNIKQKDN